MKKKLLCILLTAAMALSLAACGKAPAQSAASSGTASAAPAAAHTLDKSERITLTVGLNRKANVESYEDNALTQWLEEQTNCDIEFVYYSTEPNEWRSQVTATVAAGEKLPDVMWGLGWNDDERNIFGDDGYLLDMMEFFGDEAYMNENYPWYAQRVEELFGPEKLPKVLRAGQNGSGKLYGFPSIGYSESDLPQDMTYINQTWLDKLGLEMPTTYDEFVEVLRAFKTQDPNGNGIQDELPAVGAAGMTSSDLPSWILNNFEFVNDAFLFNVTDGKLWLPYTTDNYREGLKALRDLVSENLLPTMTWTIAEASEMNALWTPNSGTALCGVFCGHILLRTNTDSPIMYEYQPLPPFNYAPLKASDGSYYGYISADTEYPERAFDLWMQFSTLEGTLRTRYGVPGEDWEYGNDAVTGRRGVKILNSNAYGGQTHTTWGGQAGLITKYDMENIYTTIITSTDLSWFDARNLTNRTHGKQYLEVAKRNNPPELIYKLSYTEEENELRGNVAVDLLSFVREARAQFAGGERDPYNDADWDAYCKTVESLGVDKLLQAAQSAYDRAKQG